jgi:hypothetical protein
MALTPKVNEDTDPKRRYTEEVDDAESLIRPKTDADNEVLDAYVKELAFLREKVEVMILPSADPNDQARLVEVCVNGTTYYFLRGEWRTVPRFVLEVLATAKHQAWSFGYKNAQNGATVQTNDSSHILRFPHQFRDSNPLGYKWYDSIKDRVH